MQNAVEPPYLYMFVPEGSLFNLMVCIGQMFFIFTNYYVESRGKTVFFYSKFSVNTRPCSLATRHGMLIIYLPSALLSTSALLVNDMNSRSFWTFLCLTAHFVKRTLECLYLHVYSGKMDLMTSLYVSGTYMTTSGLIMYQQLNVDNDFLATSANWTLALGQFLVCVGFSGNFYHHWLLARLRSGSNEPGRKHNTYEPPRGGLFRFVTAPHYFFELHVWFGIAFMSQHITTWLAAFTFTTYLTGRAVATTNWYRGKFGCAYAAQRHIFPGIF